MRTGSAVIAAFILIGASCAYAGSVDTIAKTLYHEARGEGEDGMRAVAAVIFNRCASRYNEVTADLCVRVVKRRRQFSCWNGKADLPAGRGAAWDVCLEIAREIESGDFIPSHGFTHYYAYKKCCPSWAGGRVGARLGNHIFLNVL